MGRLTGSIEPLLLTVTQAAQLLGFGRSKMYELVRSGKIPTIAVEGKLRVTRKALYAWIEQRPRSTSRASALYS